MYPSGMPETTVIRFFGRSTILFLNTILKILKCLMLNNIWIVTRNLDCVIDHLEMQLNEKKNVRS